MVGMDKKKTSKHLHLQTPTGIRCAKRWHSLICEIIFIKILVKIIDLETVNAVFENYCANSRKTTWVLDYYISAAVTQ